MTVWSIGDGADTGHCGRRKPSHTGYRSRASHPCVPARGWWEAPSGWRTCRSSCSCSYECPGEPACVWTCSCPWGSCRRCYTWRTRYQYWCRSGEWRPAGDSHTLSLAVPAWTASTVRAGRPQTRSWWVMSCRRRQTGSRDWWVRCWREWTGCRARDPGRSCTGRSPCVGGRASGAQGRRVPDWPRQVPCR